MIMTTRLSRNTVSLAALLALFTIQAHAAESSTGAPAAAPMQAGASAGADPCAQLRAQIAAQAEILPRPNVELLGKVGANEQCHFTSAETYRAAWGAKPLNLPEPRGGGHDEDD
ncbi:MAG: hypothetical protein KA733_06095 [Thauera sp.]|jgi:hypothetical protein|nr:hypothetical protein [Thauera sp.]